MLKLALAVLCLVPAFASAESQRREIGALHARALVDIAPGAARPLVILIPGSGPNGPEEMMPKEITQDGAPHALFNELSSALRAGGVNTLALGKPGVDYSVPGEAPRFYDRDLYVNLTWPQLLDTVAAAVDYARAQPGVDPARIYILGHSEGTVVATDYAARDPRVKGLVLLGYFGQPLSEIIDWQLFRRQIENFVIPDVDTDGNGKVTKEEAARWPELSNLKWDSRRDYLTFSEIENQARENPELLKEFEKAERNPLWKDIFTRDATYRETAKLRQDLYVFNGELDLQTPALEARELGRECHHLQKENCEVTIVPGVGHGFSAPKGPRAHPLLDITVGPMSPSFLSTMTELARRFAR